MAITSQIVLVDATVTAAPAPSSLQQSGALVSFGGSTLTTNNYQYCPNLAAVTAILSVAGNHAEIANMATTYFAQGSAVGVYVLELGVQATIATQITLLATWTAANPGVFYAYLTPVAWDAANAAAVETLAATYAGETGKTYFFVTTTTGTIAAYTSKSVVATVQSPTAGATEIQAAALFYQWLSNNPAIASPSPQMDFRYVFGVTPWAQNGNAATINTILTDFGNVISTGAEGGISTALIRNGTTMDGNQMMFWYANDWVVIQAERQLANAVINGSNSNPPLYYNQFGINQLLAVLNKIGTSGISFGLLLNARFTATPFTTYTQANPSDYAAGIYKGFACTETPQLGFTQITFFLSATTFA